MLKGAKDKSLKFLKFLKERKCLSLSEIISLSLDKLTSKNSCIANHFKLLLMMLEVKKHFILDKLLMKCGTVRG